MQSVSIYIGVPEAGWLPIEITSSEYNLSLEASDLGLNVIDQLIEVAKKLKEAEDCEWYFYLEPGAYLLSIKNIEGKSLFQIDLIEDFNHQDISDPELQFQCQIDPISFHYSILKALRAFFNFEYDFEVWPKPEKTHLLDEMLSSL